jgi:hypothetical protein
MGLLRPIQKGASPPSAATEMTVVTAELGHKERFLPPRLSGGYKTRLGTFARSSGNERDAPKADRGGLKRGRQQSTHCGHSLASTATAAHAPMPPSDFDYRRKVGPPSVRPGCPLSWFILPVL